MKKPYPVIEPYIQEYLPVGSGHELYLEQYGNPKGQPVIFLHGGPGGNIKQGNSQYFNTKKYRVIMFEQRGCGRSKFQDLLKDNTTWDLVNDIEKIRIHLEIEKWHVFGASWGTTLALAYAEAYPDKVISLHLRGICFGSPEEDKWLFIEGANKFFPDKFQAMSELLGNIPADKRLAYLADQVMSPDRQQALKVSKILNDWEGAIMKLIPREPEPIPPEKEQELLNSKKVMMHYLVNSSFIEPDQLLKNAGKIRPIPTVIIHGRYDVVCPFINAWRLHQVLPEAAFEIVPDAGHHHSDPGNQQQIIIYTDKFLKLTSGHKV
jgi:proline iminopeptidase